MDLLETRLHHTLQLRQVGVSPLAIEQNATKLLLEQLIRSRQRGLRHIASARPPREVEIFANGEEVSDLVHLQYHLPDWLIGATDAGTTFMRWHSQKTADQPAAVTASGYGIEAHSAFPIRPGLTDHEATGSRWLHLVASIWAQRNSGDMDMRNQIRNPFMLRQGLCAVALMTGVVLAVPASAGECPADKVRPGVRTQGQMHPKGVTETVLASVDLSKEKVNLADHHLRTRRLVIQPGGVVSWHSHEDRPALIYIVSGVIQEHASNCSVPIVHKAGEVSVERSGVHHWWKNSSRAPVVLLSSDVFHDTPEGRSAHDVMAPF